MIQYDNVAERAQAEQRAEELFGDIWQDESPPERERRLQRKRERDTHRLRVADEMRQLGLYADADRYEDCCRPGLGVVEYCPECADNAATVGDFYRRRVPFRCMSRVCPKCGPYLASQVQAYYLPVIEEMLRRPVPVAWLAPWQESGTGLKRVELTRSVALDGPDAGEKIRATLDAARQLCEIVGWKSAGTGAVAALEVGPNGFKLHVHLLVYGPFRWKSAHSERVYQAQNGLPLRASGGPYVSETWEDLTGDYIVNVRDVRDLDDALYALKYVVKGADALPPAIAANLHAALKGTRRVRGWGVFYGKARQAFMADVEDKPEIDQVGHCPKCGGRTFWGPLWMLEELERGKPRLIDLIKTNKSPSGRGDTGPPKGLKDDPRLGPDGLWRDESFIFDL